MTDAQRAYRAAEAAIARTFAEGSDTLDLNAPEFRELAVLPPSVRQLTKVRVIELDYTKVAEIAALEPLTRLRHLFMDHVPVRDLGPIAGMTGLTRLTLSHTHVEDISPLRNLRTLELLTLDFTAVTDLSPLIGLDRLTTLSIENTQVYDLSPLLRLPGLWGGGGVHGIVFAGCTAALRDPVLSGISETKEKLARATTLRRYLETLNRQG